MISLRRRGCLLPLLPRGRREAARYFIGSAQRHLTLLSSLDRLLRNEGFGAEYGILCPGSALDSVL